MLWWIFKHTVTDNSNVQIIKFEQKRRFAGKIADQVIFLDSKDLRLTDYGTIKQVEIEQIVIKDNERAEQPLFSITVVIDNLSPIEGPNNLDAFAFSLVRIRNFERPETHFGQLYARISEVEFDAIVKGDVFEARTAFGLIANSLHLTHRTQLVQMIVQRYPRIVVSRRSIDYSRLTDVLVEYIQNNILLHAQWTVEIDTILSEIFPNQAEDVCLKDPGDKRKDNIRRQALRIRESNGQLSSESIKDVILGPPDERKPVQNFIQARFSNLFRNAPLPIRLS